MKKLLIVVVLLPHLLSGQSFHKKRLRAVYALAIGDFIKASNKRYGARFDTLFFGKRRFGQDDVFPDITLPLRIENTTIQLISPEEGSRKQAEKPSRVYINLLSWISKNQFHFDFIVFSAGFAHQYDCKLIYLFDPVKEHLRLQKVTFKDPPFDP